MKDKNKILAREVLLAFWKVHILHHAGEGPLVGQWMLSELREHGYDVSPGTLYPLLRRMEQYGWLRSKADGRRGARARREYFLTTEGRKVLNQLRDHIAEMHGEVVRDAQRSRLQSRK
ncbi:MAG: helix-turn-helix transcriptional regulator [Candidatus Hydrogenedentes bacterium]|nr:helix-turn-helix transcriptional regulator [Candidatus Hydrogenedentota bacterium]